LTLFILLLQLELNKTLKGINLEALMKTNKKVLFLTMFIIFGGINAAEKIDGLLNATLSPHALADLTALQNEFTDYQALAQIDDGEEEEHLFACSYKGCGQTFPDQEATVGHIKEKHGTGAKAILKNVWKALEAMQKVSDKDESSSDELNSDDDKKTKEKSTFTYSSKGRKISRINYAESNAESNEESNEDTDDSEDLSTSEKSVIQKQQTAALVSASYIAPKKENTGTGKFKCDICSKRFTRPFTLKEHRRSHTGERPLKCSTCDKTFAKQFILKKHERTHTEKKSFACDSCPANFQTKHQLERHITSCHTNKKAFSCQVCGKCFAVRYSLTRHMKVHDQATAEK
jgi:uncharacterized C2H2 Zn-finger protein